MLNKFSLPRSLYKRIGALLATVACLPALGSASAQSVGGLANFDFRDGPNEAKTLTFTSNGVSVTASMARSRMALSPDNSGTVTQSKLYGLGVHSSNDDWDLLNTVLAAGKYAINWTIWNTGETLILDFDRPVNVNTIRLGGVGIASAFPTETAFLTAIQNGQKIGQSALNMSILTAGNMVGLGEYQFTLDSSLPAAKTFAISGVGGLNHIDSVGTLQAIGVIPTTPTSPQLTIAKTGNGPWTTGQNGATYNLTVTNTGTVATNGTITVKDQLPAGVSMGTPSLPAGWTAAVSGQVVTLTNSTGTLAAGSSVTFNLPVNVSSSAASSITNKASVGGGGDPDTIPDPATCTPGSTNPNNQCASYTTTVTPASTPTPIGTCDNIWIGQQTEIGYMSATSGAYTKVLDLSNNSRFYVNSNYKIGDLAWGSDNKLYFLRYQGGVNANYPTELWVYDPQAGTTTPLGNIDGGAGRQVNTLYGTKDGRLLFGSTKYARLSSVSLTNPTAAGTTWATGPGPDSSGMYYAAGDITTLNNVAYVTWSTGIYTAPINSSENPTAGLTQLSPSIPFAFGITTVNGKLYASGSTSTTTNIGVSSVGEVSPSTGAFTRTVGTVSAQINGLTSLVGCDTPPVVYPQLTIAKTGNGPWTAGQSGATYNLTVTNNSTVATNGTITVQDQLPDGITMGTPALPSGWTASVSGQLVTLTNSTGILSAGGSVTFNLPVNVSSSAASTITNKASVGGGGDPDPIPAPTTCTPGSTNPNNQCASYTTTVTIPPSTPAVCTNMYAMVITNTVKDAYGNPILYNGGKIQRLDETTNTLTGSAITLPSGSYSATLGVAPDGSKFYTADDNFKLQIYNTSTNTWSTGGTFSGVADRLVRMAVTPNGTGYAMDSSGNLWSFTPTGSITSIGKLAATSTTAPNFFINGDFVSTADGKLYLLSAQTGGTVSLWYVNPVAKTAEYLGDLTSAASNVQYNGIAATPNGIFAANSAGNLGKIDPVAVTISSVGGTTTGSTDLTSCYYPDYKPILNAVKSVAKVGGSAGTEVRPGDTLEYTVTIRNSGNLPAGGVLFRDALPAGTTYVADSAKINGFTSTNTAGTTTSLAGATYPFSGTKGVGICSKGSAACTNQVLKPDTTPGTIDNEAVVTFRVTVNAGVSSVTNQAVITYNDGNTPPTDIPSNPVTTPVVPLPLAQCTNLYGLMMTPGSAAYPAYGTSIQLIGDTNNVLGATVATLPNGQTSATLAVSPDGSKFFTAADTSTNSMPLLVYTTSTGQWTTGGTFTLGSSSDRLVRMGVTKDGIGYAMDSAGKLYSFQTAAPYGVTALGQVTSNSSGAPALSWNGDMFASDKGLYMLSSVDGTASIDLWLINPTTRNAEYLGRLSDPGQTNAQYNGFAATPNGVFGRDNFGRLVKIDLQNVTLVPVGTPTNGSTDLTSCYYPSFAPNITAIKTVKKVAGTTGADVYPGDTLEYTITVRNAGDLPAGGVTFQDALPAGTTYVADSAKINGATTTVTSGTATSLAGAAYPFTNPVGICSNSIAPCTTQVLKIDSTPNTIDNEAVITFRVKVVDPFTLNPSQVANQAFIKYTDGPNGGVPSDDPTTPTPNDPTITPVIKPVKLIAEKTVQNITANGPIGVSSSGKPGDVLEYCIKTSNVGSANATNIRFGDNVPANTNFLVNAYGAGKDIHVTTSTGTDVYYTSTQDSDAGALVSGRVTVNGGTFVLQPTQTFTVCFRATIQ